MSRTARGTTFLALLLATGAAAAHGQLPHRPTVPGIHLPGGSGSAAKPVTFDQVTLELTPARLDAALRGFAAEEREGPRIAAGYRQKESAYQGALRAWTARDSARKAQQAAAGDCYQHATSGDQAAAQQRAQAMQANANDPRTQARIKDLQTRLQAAGQKQDMPTVMALSDSLRQVMGMNGSYAQGMQASQAHDAAARGRCGVDSATSTMAATASDTEPTPPRNPRDSVSILAAQAGGFTVAQYAMVRERVLGYLSVDEDKLRPSSWAFSQGELDALKSRRSQLAAYQPMLASE